MKINKEITIETIDDISITGTLVDTVELNKIARNNGGLTYLMNVMDVKSGKNAVYMWFKDAGADKNYFVEIR